MFSSHRSGLKWRGALLALIFVLVPTAALAVTFTRDVNIGGFNGYLNFGSTTGSGGYGIRDNDGTIEVKNSGGSWAEPGGSGVDLIASGSFPAAATLDVTNIPSTYSYLIIQFTGASSNTHNRNVLVRLSSDNGSSFDTTPPDQTSSPKIPHSSLRPRI